MRRYIASAKTILFDANGDVLISLDAQKSVHEIMRLKERILVVYSHAGLSERQKHDLSVDLDSFQGEVRRLRIDVTNKISDEGVDIEEVAQELVNHLFAHDIEEGKI
jgi:hypothetical protein